MDPTQIRFAITHPMHTHPYHPDVVSGTGIVQIAAAAEKAGIHGFGFTDHPAPSQRWLEHGGHDALDPFVAMSFAAAHTTTLRLIPNIVVLPYRNPFVVAKAAATLDLLSDGRFTLAVGVGYMRKEFDALGVDYEQRAELFEEALQAIRAVWTTDDLTFEGKHFAARGITAHPRPVAKPHPPIWIAGNTGSARRRVAQYGDGWCPFPAPAGLARTAKTAPIDSIERLRTLIADLHAQLEAAGRDPASVDVAFSPFYATSPGDDAFNPDEFLSGLEQLAAAGVTWVNINIPGDGVSQALDALDRFRATVIEAL